jgi:hypothetical protein
MESEMTIPFKVIRDWESEMYLRSPKFNNTDFDYWLIASLTYMEALRHDFKERYHMQLWVIAPSQVPEIRRDGYLGSTGLNDEEWAVVDSGDQEGMVEYLVESGCGVIVWSKSGNNKATLLTELRKEAEIVNLLFGFYLDRPVNMIGTTGWDMLTGDVMAGLNRKVAA